MRLIAGIIAIVAGLAGLISIAYPTYTHRYRLTIEIKTADGPKSASNVIEAVRRDNGWFPLTPNRYEYLLRGDALFLDLGEGKNLVALLAHGRYGERSRMTTLALQAYGYVRGRAGSSDDTRESNEAWSGRAKMAGPVEIHAPLVPTLVSFSDLSDQKTAQVVYATEEVEIRVGSQAPRYVSRVATDRFGEIFGPGFGFSRASLEVVRHDRWPFNLLGITGPPITRGIEDKVIGLKNMQRWLDVLRAQPFSHERLRLQPTNFTRDDW